MPDLTRRKLLAASIPVIGLGAAAASQVMGEGASGHGQHAGHGAPPKQKAKKHAGHKQGHASFRGGKVNTGANGFDPHQILRDFDWGKASRLASGRTLREWDIVATTREIEVAPGVKFSAWTYNGRVPGPTIRANEGDRLRVRFVNASEHPHTIHFHGIHPSDMDGVPGIGAGMIQPNGHTVYEFDALPAGMHLYHCHVRPLAEHIAKGMFGAFIIDPPGRRARADEMVMVMHGYDTNFDRANEIYAVNGIGFTYMDRPIQVRRNQLVRIYLANTLEYDPINSFHLHGNLFHYYPTGTGKEPAEFTDTIMQCQGQRGILETSFPHPGSFMFHAHQSEFAELGWQGFFEVR